MYEYIERKKLYNNLVLLAKYETGERQQGILGCAETVRIFPAANVAEVVHGKWEWDTEDIYRCSNCAEKSHVKEVMGHPEWDYCPNCGAKMDGGNGNSDMA